MKKPEKKSFLSFGLVGLALSAIGLFTDRAHFFGAYLEGFLLVFGLTLGSLGIWILHALVGGQWGDPILRVARAASRSLPLLILLFLPLGIGASVLYPWANGAAEWRPKAWYLNLPFFWLRAVLYFVVWSVLLRGLNRREETKGEALENWAGISAIALVFSTSFAAVDWIMSLEPHYYSTIWGALVLTSQLQGAFAFCVLFSKVKIFPLASVQKWNDLGNLLLMSASLWMYMVFSQYLIVWSGQIKAEVAYYNARLLGGWGWLGGILLLGNFAFPFLLLMFRAFKRSPSSLAFLAAGLIVMQWAFSLWLVGPALSPMRFKFSWLDILLPFSLGSLWLWSVLGQFKTISPVPEQDREVAHYAV